jgi:RNA polymerase sigma factor (sigma-70 family)
MPLDHDELSLVQRTLDGDHDAFGVLVLIYERPLLAYIYSILRDKEYTHDIAQETFTTAYYALSHWTSPVLDAATSTQTNGEHEKSYFKAHPLAPWLYRIATNKALQFLKKQTHFEYSSIQLAEATLSNSDIPEERYLVKELLQEVLSSLSEEDALCIVLRFGFHEPYSDIATKIHSSAEAVRKRISRKIHILRSAYATMQDREVSL